MWGRVYGLGKIGRGKVYDSLQEYSPLLKSRGFVTEQRIQFISALNNKCLIQTGKVYQ